MGEDEGLAITDLSGLLSLVQAGVLEIHPWGATLADPEKPDRITFDLDPDESVPFGTVVASAIEVREKLASLGLESFVKTTGGKGLHVVVPLAPAAGWDRSRASLRNSRPGSRATFPTATPRTWRNAPGVGGYSSIICEIPAARPPSPPIRPELAPGRRCLCRSPGRSFPRFGPEVSTGWTTYWGGLVICPKILGLRSPATGRCCLARSVTPGRGAPAASDLVAGMY
jgi:hypothetical protein